MCVCVCVCACVCVCVCVCGVCVGVHVHGVCNLQYVSVRKDMIENSLNNEYSHY